ncbi:MAG: hypothetical protein RLY93_07100 [Sumerlaeia bacterium]
MNIQYWALIAELQEQAEQRDKLCPLTGHESLYSTRTFFFDLLNPDGPKALCVAETICDSVGDRFRPFRAVYYAKGLKYAFAEYKASQYPYLFINLNDVDWDYLSVGSTGFTFKAFAELLEPFTAKCERLFLTSLEPIPQRLLEELIKADCALSVSAASGFNSTAEQVRFWQGFFDKASGLVDFDVLSQRCIAKYMRALQAESASDFGLGFVDFSRLNLDPKMEPSEEESVDQDILDAMTPEEREKSDQKELEDVFGLND